MISIAINTGVLQGGSRNCTAGFHLHYTDALQKFRSRASSGNPVIYNCSNPGLCGRNFCFCYPIFLHTELLDNLREVASIVDLPFQHGTPLITERETGSGETVLADYDSDLESFSTE